MVYIVFKNIYIASLFLEKSVIFARSKIEIKKTNDRYNVVIIQ